MCNGSGVVPSFQAIESVDAWAAILSEMGVDAVACRDWQSLFTASDKGRMEAMCVVHKILKKEQGGPTHAVRKPGAFVCAAVRAAWHEVRGDRR